MPEGRIGPLTRTWLLVGSSLGLASCISGPTDCPAGEPGWAVTVQFRDSAADTLIRGLTPGVIRDGSYTDSLRVFSVDSIGRPTVLAAGRNRPGTYSLEALRPGYEPVVVSGLIARAGGCGVQTVFTDVEMSPAGS